MSDKEFGIKFTKTDHGFRIEVNGDDEIINAHQEMADAWKEFVSKARQTAKVHFDHHHHARHGCCTNVEQKEDIDIQDVKDVNPE